MQRLIKAALKWPCSELEQCRGIFTSENLIQNIAKSRNWPDLTILYHYITMLTSLFYHDHGHGCGPVKKSAVNQPFLILPFFYFKICQNYDKNYDQGRSGWWRRQRRLPDCNVWLLQRRVVSLLTSENFSSSIDFLYLYFALHLCIFVFLDFCILYFVVWL